MEVGVENDWEGEHLHPVRTSMRSRERKVAFTRQRKAVGFAGKRRKGKRGIERERERERERRGTERGISNSTHDCSADVVTLSPAPDCTRGT